MIFSGCVLPSLLEFTKRKPALGECRVVVDGEAKSQRLFRATNPFGEFVVQNLRRFFFQEAGLVLPRDVDEYIYSCTLVLGYRLLHDVLLEGEQINRPRMSALIKFFEKKYKRL